MDSERSMPGDASGDGPPVDGRRLVGLTVMSAVLSGVDEWSRRPAAITYAELTALLQDLEQLLDRLGVPPAEVWSLVSPLYDVDPLPAACTMPGLGLPR